RAMHRPTPSDLVTFSAPALSEAPQLLAPLEHVKHRIDERDMEGDRELLEPLERALDEAELSRMAERGARKGVAEARDGLGRDAYWRQRTWKKVGVIFAGPGTNLVFAIILFAILFVIGSGGYRLGFSMETNAPIVHDVRSDHPAAQIGLQPGDRILRINGHKVDDVSQVPNLIEQSKGKAIRLLIRRKGESGPMVLGPVRARAEP